MNAHATEGPRGRVNQRVAADRIAQRQTFNAGSLRATTDRTGTGRLPEEWAERYRAGPVVYVVLSYATPIGWVTATGAVVVPDEHYSMTTSRHQGIVRRALGVPATNTMGETQ